MQGTSDISHILWILQVNSQYTFTFIFNVIFGITSLATQCWDWLQFSPMQNPNIIEGYQSFLEAFENHYELQIHSCVIPRDKLSRQVI